jgi:hypothetical protein
LGMRNHRGVVERETPYSQTGTMCYSSPRTVPNSPAVLLSSSPVRFEKPALIISGLGGVLHHIQRIPRPCHWSSTAPTANSFASPHGDVSSPSAGRVSDDGSWAIMFGEDVSTRIMKQRREEEQTEEELARTRQMSNVTKT